MKKVRFNNSSLVLHFENMQDYRIKRTKKYELIDIIMIAICAIIAGANDWTDVAAWGEANQKWLRKFIKLPNGTPSHDTFSRVFARIDPDCFLKCFVSWASSISKMVKKKVIAIDGKTMRGSHDRASDKSALHIVSAWATDLQLTLGQVQISEKSNEITAIPELLNMLEIKGCIITIDAMGCQKSIARDIILKKGDYVLALKNNHRDLYETAAFVFDDAAKTEYKNLKHTTVTLIEKDHGRIERRTIIATGKIGDIASPYDWAGIKSIVRVDSERTIGGIKSNATRYYITSLAPDAEKLATIIRSHWGIESMHWSLDVTFNEDKSRVRKDHGPQNLALLRKLTFSMLKRDTNSKYSVKTKRFIASFDRDYLEKILTL